VHLSGQHVRAHYANVFVHELVHIDRVGVCVECTQEACWMVHFMALFWFFYMQNTINCMPWTL
jgi:hypothetical protein